eukprot:1159360-Pelagomonas_calceolata.AAC.4
MRCLNGLSKCASKWAVSMSFLNVLHKYAVWQGFGKIGAWTAQLLQEAGAKIIGVSSAETAVYNEVREKEGKLWISEKFHANGPWKKGRSRDGNLQGTLWDCDRLTEDGTPCPGSKAHVRSSWRARCGTMIGTLWDDAERIFQQGTLQDEWCNI